MTNKEKYGNETLNKAIDAYNVDCNYLRDDAPAFWEWLDYSVRENDSIVCRGQFFTPAEIDQKIAEMEARKVTGYLLEYNEGGSTEWTASEIDTGFESNLWDGGAYYTHPAHNDWFDKEVFTDYFAALPNVWLMSSCDWKDRNGVDFDARYPEKYTPKGDGVWEGVRTERWADDSVRNWRVRKITIDGTLSELAKAFFRRNPDIWMKHTAK